MRAEKSPREQAFTELYRAYAGEIYRFVYLRAGMDKALAEDITQDIFVDIYRGMGGFGGRSSERTWVYAVARNKLGDFYRRQYRALPECVSADDERVLELEDARQDTQEAQLRELKRETVQQCLRALPLCYSQALVLKYVDEMSVKELARLLRKTPKAAESLLQRARGAFIREYKKAEGECR